MLRKELCSTKNHSTSLEAKLRKKKNKLMSNKATIKDLKKKLDEVVAWAMEVEKEAKLAKADTLNVVNNYKKLTDFKEEVNEASSFNYEYGFDDYKAKVKELFLDLDLKEVILPRQEEEEE